MRIIGYILYGWCKSKYLISLRVLVINWRYGIFWKVAVTESLYSRNALILFMAERKYTRWKKCLICSDFVKLMFPEDSKDMLIVYEPQEGMSNESRNWKKKQLGYIHRACLTKANSMLRIKSIEADEGVAEVI